jgi:hypothetical protein
MKALTTALASLLHPILTDDVWFASVAGRVMLPAGPGSLLRAIQALYLTIQIVHRSAAGAVLPAYFD